MKKLVNTLVALILILSTLGCMVVSATSYSGDTVANPKILYYLGNWQTTPDGTIQNTAPTGDWTEQAIVDEGVFSDFTMMLDLKSDTEGGWPGVILRKSNISDTHATIGNGVFLIIGADGNISTSTGINSWENQGLTLGDRFKTGFVTLEISFIKKNLKIYEVVGLDKTLMIDTIVSDNINTEGYIGLLSGNSTSSFKNIQIKGTREKIVFEDDLSSNLDKWNAYKGNWFINNGAVKLDNGGSAEWENGLNINLKKFKNFTLNYSIKIDTASWAGILFNKQTEGDTHNIPGTKMLITFGDGGTLLNGIAAPESTKASTVSSEFVNFRLIRVGNLVSLYRITKDNKIIHLVSTEIADLSESGFISLISGGGDAQFDDIYVYGEVVDLTGNLTQQQAEQWYKYDGEWIYKNGFLSNNTFGWTNGMALDGKKYGDFELIVKMQTSVIGEGGGWPGVLLRKNNISDNHTTANHGAIFSIVQSDGNIGLSAGSLTTSSYENNGKVISTGTNTKPVTLKYVVCGQSLKIYEVLLDREDLMIDVTLPEDVNKSGYLSIISGNCKTSFDSIEVVGTPTWTSNFENISYSDDFETDATAIKGVEGTWFTKDGKLKQTSLSWDSRASLQTTDKYGDFELNFDMKQTLPNGDGWAGIIMRTANDTDSKDVQTGQAWINMLGNTFSGSGINYVNMPAGANVYEGVHIKLVAKGNNVKIYVNGETTPTINHNISGMKEQGGITFVSGNCHLEIDNFSIVGKGIIGDGDHIAMGEYIMEDNNGNVITQVSNQNVIKVKRAFKNYSSFEKNTILIANLTTAENQLKNINYNEKNIVANHTQYLETFLEITGIRNGDHIKGFVWNNTNDIKPYDDNIYNYVR